MPTLPDDLPLPTENGPSPDSGASFGPTGPGFANRGGPQYNSARPYSPSRQPTFLRNATNPNNPTAGEPDSAIAEIPDAGLIGPVGYDAE